MIRNRFRRDTARAICLGGAIAFSLAGLACQDSPTAADDGSESVALFKPGGGAGGKPGGGGSSATLDFLETMSNGAAPDYVAAEQPASGGIRRNSVKASGPYTLTLQFSAADLSTCEDGGSRLAGLLGTRDGSVVVDVNRGALADDPTVGVVVNFETTVGGNDYFLTTGNGLNQLTEGNGSVTVRKTGGFIRITENGDYGVWCPARSVFDGTNGVVDFEFVFAE
ncbi:MAG: hypothetical protein ACWGON_06800 [Gemmatimonadota bacterium]